MRLTLAVAVAHTLHLTAATIVIFTLPVDIAKGLLGLLALGTDAIVLAIVLGGIGYFLRRARTHSDNPDPRHRHQPATATTSKSLSR
jgi:hypothetical protein